MIRLVIALMIGWLMGCEILHSYEENYLTNVTRYVGPTDDATAGTRGTLPQPAPDDTNSVWVTIAAEGGSDSNTGTQASPKLSINGAMAITTGTKNTIHIFRPASPLTDDPLIIPLFNGPGGSLTLTASRNIQVEYGETATIKGSSNTSLTLAGSNGINGFRLEDGSGFGESVLIIQGNSSVVANIEIWSNQYNWWGTLAFELGSAQSATVEYSKYGWIRCLIDDTNTGARTVNLNNNLHNYNAQKNDFFDTWSMAAFHLLADDVGTTAPFVFNIDRGLIVARGLAEDAAGETRNVPLFFLENTDNVSPGTVNVTLAVSNSHMSGLNNLMTMYSQFGPINVNFSATFNYCLQDFNNTINEVSFNNETITLVQTITSTNRINVANPRYMDWLALLAGDGDSSRLQWKGKSTPDGSGKFPLTSQLVGRGLAGVDINPWDESTILDTFGYAETTELQLVDNIRKGWRWTKASTRQNQRGNPRSAYKTLRRAIILGFGSGDRYANNNELYRIINLLADTGIMRFYEKGISGNRFLDPVTGLGPTSGTLSGSGGVGEQRQFTPTFSGAPAMVRRHWAGDWLTITDGSTDYEYYIINNTETTFTILDKKQIGYPANGTKDFAIYYMLCRPDLKDIEAATRLGLFEYGAASREIADGSTMKFELQGYELTLLEDEDENAI